MEKQMIKDLRTNFILLFKIVHEKLEDEKYNDRVVEYATKKLDVAFCLDVIKEYEKN